MAAARLEEVGSAARILARDALIERLRRAIERGRALPVVAAEERSGDELRPLLGDVLSAIDDAHQLLGEILDHYEPVTELDELDFDLSERPSTIVRVVEDRMSEETGVAKISGIAFVARIGLRGRREQLLGLSHPRRAAEDEKWELIAACSGAAREILKSLSAIDLAVAEHEGLPATSDYYVSEVDRARELRRAYVTFRNEILGAGPPSAADAERRLRTAGSAIAKLIGRSAYGHARVHDRASLRNLQARIRAQLTRGAEVGSGGALDPHERRVLEISAVRTWQDLANLAELFMAINNRGELREHDRQVCVRAKQMLARGDGASARALLKDIAGREPALDRLAPDATDDELSETIEALTRALSTQTADEPPPSGRHRRATDAPEGI